MPAIKGGAIESTIELLVNENEKKKQLDIYVFSSYDKEAGQLSTKYNNTKFVWIKRGILYKLVDFFIRVFRKLFNFKIDRLDSQIIKRQVRKREFDKVVIHGSTTHLSALSNVVPKNNLIFYVHANIFSIPSKINQNLGQIAGIYVAVSNFIKAEVEKNAFVPASRIKVIKNPIDLNNYTKHVPSTEIKARLKTKFNINEQDIVILFAGRIVENKGIKELILALKSLPNDTNFKLLIVGSFGSGFGSGESIDDFAKQLKNIANDLEEKVLFTGFVHNSYLPRIHSITDILVMPSLCEESAGKAAMEAMAGGIPVITTIAGGIPEYVSEDAGILLERDRDLISNLANALKILIDNKTLREAMGTKGRELAKEFAPSRFYRDYVNLILNDRQLERQDLI